MSLREYNIAQEVEQLGDWGEDFYALVMVLMKNADTTNQQLLRGCWPHVWAEVQARYNAPQGLLPGERTADGWRRDDEGNLFSPDGTLVRAV